MKTLLDKITWMLGYVFSLVAEKDKFYSYLRNVIRSESSVGNCWEAYVVSSKSISSATNNQNRAYAFINL